MLTFAGIVVVSVLGPTVLLRLQGKQRREDLAIQWARDDALSARAEAIGQRVVQANQHTAEVVEATASSTASKLEVIHTLVNSQLTKALESERDAIRRELAMMEEVVAMKKTMGAAPSEGVLAAIAFTKAKLKDLELQLEDRARQQEIVDMQLEQGKSTSDQLKATLESAGVQFAAPEVTETEQP